MRNYDQAASVAATVLALRRARNQVLPSDLFGEPAWDVLLELFVADAQGARLTVDEVSQRSSTHPSIMVRWLRVLTAHGLIMGDGDGNMEHELVLSPLGLTSVEAIMARIELEGRAFDAS